jgi:hypothetical protein
VPSAGRLVKILLGIAISVALLVWLFWKVDVRAVFARLADTHWGWLAVSIVVASPPSGRAPSAGVSCFPATRIPPISSTR